MILKLDETAKLYNVVNTGECKRYVGSGDTHLYHYAYKIKDIIHAVQRRTNYVGKNRQTKEGASLIDKMTYSNDEFDLDRPLTKDAMAQVYMPLMDFTRGISDAYHYDEGYRTFEFEKNFGYRVDITQTRINVETEQITVHLSSDKLFDDEHYITIRGEIVANVYNILGEKVQRSSRFEEVITTSWSEVDGKFLTEYTFKPHLDYDDSDNGLGSESLINFDVVEISTRIFTKREETVMIGDWLELTDEYGRKELYVCHSTCTTNNLFGCPFYWTRMYVDLRHTIHYVLYIPKVRNTASLEALDTLIENALITYCMYRWYLMTEPNEATIWLAEFEKRLQAIRELLQELDENLLYRPQCFY